MPVKAQGIAESPPDMHEFESALTERCVVPPLERLAQLAMPKVFPGAEGVEPGSSAMFAALGDWLDTQHAEHQQFAAAHPDIVKRLPELGYASVGGWFMRLVTPAEAYGVEV